MSEFDKIIGYKDVKAELIRLCDVIKNRGKYKALGVSPIGGLLLDGEPGVGKTLMANCFIKESGRRAYVCRKNKPDGEFVNEIKKTFFNAMANEPSIVLLDDMDKFANEDSYRRNAEEYVTVQSCIDEAKGRDVFVVAMTNGTSKLPDSLLRAGRFDTIIDVKAPQGQDAVEIVQYYLSTKKSVSEVNAEDIARLLNGKSCAELETVINTAGQYAGFANKEYIDMDDITRACLRVIYNAPESTAPHNERVLTILFLLYYSSNFCLYQTHKFVYTALTKLSILLTRKKQRRKSLLEFFLFYLSYACACTYITHPYSAFFGLTSSISIRHYKEFVHTCIQKQFNYSPQYYHITYFGSLWLYIVHFCKRLYFVLRTNIHKVYSAFYDIIYFSTTTLPHTSYFPKRR